VDGIRAYWDGSKMISRHSTVLNCPEWFTGELPKHIALDGELWLGRGKFERVLALKSDITHPSWKEMKYMIFDLPQSNLPYESRMEELKCIQLPPHAMVIQSTRCSGNGELLKVLEDIVSDKGEGLMVNKPQSLYVGERTKSLLKVKV
jgi:DNA ligase-1